MFVLHLSQHSWHDQDVAVLCCDEV